MEEEREMCQGQLFREKPILPAYILAEMGRGDCSRCVYDPVNNKKCSMYNPVVVRSFNVKKSDLEKKL
jgi:hypothetical protein